ncbi:MAG: VOC family protein [Anaerolineaceae bacterium]|nr:VOC family protein [Anaerolineaceae bacterium]
MSIRYTHTNIIAKDWRSLAEFYVQVFGCKLVLPERDLSGKWIDRLTNFDGCSIKGAHLELPGYEMGPTLEIFSYDPEDTADAAKTINRLGYGHLAFHVDDVQAMLNKLLENGGSQYGDLVSQRYADGSLLTVVYACDPEGNIVELQNRKK